MCVIVCAEIMMTPLRCIRLQLVSWWIEYRILYNYTIVNNTLIIMWTHAVIQLPVLAGEVVRWIFSRVQIFALQQKFSSLPYLPVASGEELFCVSASGHVPRIRRNGCRVNGCAT